MKSRFRATGSLRAVFAVCSLILAASCSFNYGTSASDENPLPEMVLRNAVAQRYENESIALTLNAAVLEMYPSDEVWAAEGVTFTQFSSDGSGKTEAEGSAGILLIDDREQTYTLGENAHFHLVSDDIRLAAPALRWVKRLHRLSGSADGEVVLFKGDGTEIRGTGFYADTLSRDYSFRTTVSGSLVSGSGDIE
jgi:hypothetical protein